MKTTLKRHEIILHVCVTTIEIHEALRTCDGFLDRSVRASANHPGCSPALVPVCLFLLQRLKAALALKMAYLQQFTSVFKDKHVAIKDYQICV